MDLNLRGKRVLVTGGSGDLGGELCRRFAVEGSDVAVAYAGNREGADALARELSERHGVRALALGMDVGNEDSVEALFDAAEAGLGGEMNVLVNNAGICPVTLVKDMSFAEWRRVMSVNLDGVFLASRSFVRRLVAKNLGGRIVNIASQAAYNGSKRGKTHYAASKGGVISFTISLAKEVAGAGIAVNAVAPGIFPSRIMAEVLAKEEQKYRDSITIGRIASLAEVADMTLFAASERAGYSTGAVFDVTGGMMSR